MDLQKFFRKPSSKEVAKERLRLVLIQDRSAVSPQLMDRVRGRILEAVSEFLEVDEQGLEVNLNHRETRVALVANIPIRKVKRGAGL
ncbi:MAG: cell division topological specificity factor MinE [Firmicutes bacterium]|nr:cell division topological specificity factor MinE [Bacillota bacterium]